MTKDAHSDENIIETSTYSNHLKNSKSKSGTIGSEIKFLWSPDAKETICLIQGTVCKESSRSYTSGKEAWNRHMVTVKELIILHHWSKNHLEKLPESLVIDPKQNEI